MALSRIWSAFIITAIIVASFKYFLSHDQQIFSRMVTGKADDPYDSIGYTFLGSPQKGGFSSREDFGKLLAPYGYSLKDSVQNSSVLITDNEASDSVKILKSINPSLSVFTYRSIQKKLVKKADGII